MYYKYSLVTLIYLTRVQLKITTQSKLNVPQASVLLCCCLDYRTCACEKKLEFSWN